MNQAAVMKKLSPYNTTSVPGTVTFHYHPIVSFAPWILLATLALSSISGCHTVTAIHFHLSKRLCTKFPCTVTQYFAWATQLKGLAEGAGNTTWPLPRGPHTIVKSDQKSNHKRSWVVSSIRSNQCGINVERLHSKLMFHISSSVYRIQISAVIAHSLRAVCNGKLQVAV